TIAASPAAATSLVVSATATATAAIAFPFSVTAQDQFNNTATDYRGTVHFTTTDNRTGVVVPADYTFVSGDNGVHTFSNGATLVRSDKRSVSATNTTSMTSNCSR